jgi:1,4-dihydroxy-2-naphthoate polyprenyltransferase
MRWWQVFNPAIYLISVLPAIVVLLIAGKAVVWTQGLVISTIAVILLQHAINLFNDVSDWNLGADTEKMDSWVRLFDGKTGPVTIQALVSAAAGGITGLSVLYVGDKLSIVYIALPLITLGYLYNAGKSPLSYTWMGEWVTGICYGGVFACLWLVAGLTLNFEAVMGTMAVAALAMSLLLSHQPPQFETDRAVGKKSFCVRYGIKKTKQVSVFLFTFSLLFIGLGVSFNQAIPSLQYMLITLILLFSLYLLKVGPSPKRVLILSSALLLSMTMWTLLSQTEQVVF